MTNETPKKIDPAYPSGGGALGVGHDEAIGMLGAVRPAWSVAAGDRTFNVRRLRRRKMPAFTIQSGIQPLKAADPATGMKS